MFLNFPTGGTATTMVTDRLNTFPALLQLAQNLKIREKGSKNIQFNLMINNKPHLIRAERRGNDRGMHRISERRKDKGKEVESHGQEQVEQRRGGRAINPQIMLTVHSQVTPGVTSP